MGWGKGAKVQGARCKVQGARTRWHEFRLSFSRPVAVTPALTSAQAVGRVRTLNHRAELRVADSGLLARGADGSRTDPDLDNVGARDDELLHHLARHDVSSHDDLAREALAVLAYCGDEELRVPVGDVEADHADVGNELQRLRDRGKVAVAAASAHRDVGEHLGVLLRKCCDVLRPVVVGATWAC